jgi:hypothetical protein
VSRGLQDYLICIGDKETHSCTMGFSISCPTSLCALCSWFTGLNLSA